MNGVGRVYLNSIGAFQFVNVANTVKCPINVFLNQKFRSPHHNLPVTLLMNQTLATATYPIRLCDRPTLYYDP